MRGVLDAGYRVVRARRFSWSMGRHGERTSGRLPVLELKQGL
jgi:hypothetical protein